ncbi:Phospholipase C [Saitoella coloradoensis]
MPPAKASVEEEKVLEGLQLLATQDIACNGVDHVERHAGDMQNGEVANELEGEALSKSHDFGMLHIYEEFAQKRLFEEPQPQAAPLPAFPRPVRSASMPIENTKAPRPSETTVSKPSILRRLSRGSRTMSSALGPVTQRRRSSSDPSKPHELEPGITESTLVHESLQSGIALLRVTRKKVRERIFMLHLDSALVTWDTKSTSRFAIDDIKEIRCGGDARNYREQFKISTEHEPRWMTIIYAQDRKLKALHLIAPTTKTHELWRSTLERLYRYRVEMMGGLGLLGRQSLTLITRQWRETEKTHDSHLTFEEVERLCRKLHVNTSRAYLKGQFDEADENTSGKLSFAQFQQFVKRLKERREVVNLFRKYAANHVAMTVDEFVMFCIDVQKRTQGPDELCKVYAKYCDKCNDEQFGEQETSSCALTVEGFTRFLHSHDNPILVSTELDMSRPLNDYFISSSHNTYLLGRQVAGESSVEGYIRVLQRGCRCVEIDCWDGPDGPAVFHGRTFTSKIKFVDVVQTIAKYAFLVTPFPLIISLEVHCNAEQQQTMVDLLRSNLGEALVTEPIRNDDGKLPSPMDLKHRILLKVKNHSIEDPDDSYFIDSSSTSTTDTAESDTVDSEAARPVLPSTSKPSPKPKHRAKIIKPLADLAVYSKALKYRNFSLPESKTYNHIFSFSERTFKQVSKAVPAQLMKHNSRYLMRIYPSAYRISSSNFEPTRFWRKGVQMVALNWQTYDLGLQMNDAMFAAGRTGYTVKPHYLWSSEIQKGVPTIWTVLLKLQVISAQQLPRPRDSRADVVINPCVEVEVFADDSETEQLQTLKKRTHTFHNNGFNPVWDESFRFELPACRNKDLVFVRFSVYNDDGHSNAGTLFATYCVRLRDLGQGFRHVPLSDLQGEQFLFSTLFIKVGHSSRS